MKGTTLECERVREDKESTAQGSETRKREAKQARNLTMKEKFSGGATHPFARSRRER